MDDKLRDSINDLCKYLAKRDISELTKKAVLGEAGIMRFDIAIVFGSDITQTVEHAAKAYHSGLCKKILLCGGIGHSTKNLRDSVKRKYGIDTQNMAEGDILATVAMVYLGVPQKDILSENQSTNCGENAEFSLKLLAEREVNLSNMLLFQDPFLQRRSHLTLKMRLNNCNLISFAPLIPSVEDFFEEKQWSKPRFFELMTREIPRLRDDEQGYGPRGKGFLPHCEIPEKIEACQDFILKNKELIFK